MHYAQRLLAALPSTRLGARAILAVLTAFGIILTTAGVAAMPLLNEGKAVEESEGGVACRPAARMVYPEGQSAPEYVVPVYETKYGVESILSDWCDAAGEVLEDPTITLNVVEGNTVTPHLLPGIHAELERPAPANGEQDVFIPTDYLVKGMRQATGDDTWDVGKRVFSLTFTSGTVSATTGMFSFVKQDPGIVNPPSPEPTTEPSAEPSAEPTTEPTPQPTSEPEPTTEPTNEPTAAPTTGPTAEPAPEPTQKPTPTPSATPSSEPTATATHSATPGPTPTSSASPTNTTCQVAPTASVLTPDGAEPKGTEPVYDPEVAVRVSGTGWCSQGTMLDGEKSVEIKMMAHGGYAVPGTVSVPVTFHNGSFGAQLNLSALYTAGKAEKGHYYLQISPIETGLTAGTNVFVLNKSVTPQPVPTPTAGPTAEPSTGPAPAPSGEPTSEPSAAPSASAPPTQPTSPKTGSESATDTSGGNVPSNQGSGSGGQSDTGSSSDVSDRSDSSDRSDADAPPADVPAEPGADQGRAQDSDHRSNSDTSATEDSRASTQADAGTAALEDRTVRPTANPVAPVSSSAQLSADNAGSLSGSRQGNVVNLVLPKAKVSAGEWVSVFVFPGATTKGWVQVDDANSVSIDISTFESGSYELAVADRDNSLLGWAKLEITSASFDPRSPAQAQLLTFPDDDSSTPMGLSTNDMLLGGAGGLLVIGAGSLLVAAHSGMPLRVPHAPRRPRIPRRR
ncbi:hypothetical protein [Actinomyces naeslundii]|uniref:hypothetical protein n=1 Tax=Actinomyces naeslundii TaxID=1655 RepID=UPI00094D4D29|nr:hypothetical protein [Actinomyces naeslundii]OLO91050.1 hypothetical protein BKH10_04860 [Actinomyces naeslundii]OMG11210.1 hypothetical protein BKH07_04435 [Actinomyces naeslundii]